MATKKKVWGNHQWVMTSCRSLSMWYLTELQPGHEANGVAHWPAHMAKKNRVNLEAFLEAFGKALQTHKWEKVDLGATAQYARKLRTR